VSKPLWAQRVAGGVLSCAWWGLRLCLWLVCGLASIVVRGNEFCGNEGVWVQVLGSGGSDLAAGRGGAGYLVWHEGKARVLVDAGPGSALRFAESGAKFEDLDVVLFTNLHPDSSWDFPVLLRRAYWGYRKAAIDVIAPAGNNRVAGPEETFRPWLKFDPRQVYPADLLATIPSPIPAMRPFKVRFTEVAAEGRRTWNGWRNEHLRVQAVPVSRGALPALAWRIEIGSLKLAFAGAFSGYNNTVTELARDGDMLVVHLGTPEGERSRLRNLYAPPSVIGRTAAAAGIRPDRRVQMPFQRRARNRIDRQVERPEGGNVPID